MGWRQNLSFSCHFRYLYTTRICNKMGSRTLLCWNLTSMQIYVIVISMTMPKSLNLWYMKNRELTIERSIAWKKAHLERHNALKRSWAEKNKSKRSEARWRKQGIVGATWGLYEQMLREQGGKCALCQRLPGKRALGFDHRGLLCTACGTGVRWAEWLGEGRLAAYLARHGCPES